MSPSISTSVEKSINTNVYNDIMIQNVWLIIYNSSLTDDLQRVHFNRFSAILAYWFKNSFVTEFSGTGIWSQHPLAIL